MVFRTAFYDKPNKSSNKIQQIPFKEAGLHIVGGSNNMGGSLSFLPLMNKGSEKQCRQLL